MKGPFYTRFFLSYLFLLVFAFAFGLFVDHGEVVLWINQHRTPLLDFLMPRITYLGDGLLFALVSVGLIVYRWRLGLLFSAAGITQALISVVLKRGVFGKVPRPTKYFEELGISLNLLPNVDYAQLYSFPSGHTMTVFMLTALISFLWLPRRWHMLMLSIAILGGISRIYLLQHFYIDVIAGSVVGVALAVVFAYLIYPRFLEKRG